MRLKAYLVILSAHMTVLTALVTPIIRTSFDEASSEYMNIFQFAEININSLSTFLMLFLTLVHIAGVGNSLYGIFKRSYSHISINMTFICGLASALMGALQLYSKSYALFSICAITFFVISFCSIKLIKSEG